MAVVKLVEHLESRPVGIFATPISEEDGAQQPYCVQKQTIPWSVDRWGRLIAGCSVILFLGLSQLHHSIWLLGLLGVALNLVVNALTDKCLVHDLLIKLGAKEREDLFLPGGALRPGL